MPQNACSFLCLYVQCFEYRVGVLKVRDYHIGARRHEPCPFLFVYSIAGLFVCRHADRVSAELRRELYLNKAVPNVTSSSGSSFCSSIMFFITASFEQSSRASFAP